MRRSQVKRKSIGKDVICIGFISRIGSACSQMIGDRRGNYIVWISSRIPISVSVSELVLLSAFLSFAFGFTICFVVLCIIALGLVIMPGGRGCSAGGVIAAVGGSVREGSGSTRH